LQIKSYAHVCAWAAVRQRLGMSLGYWMNTVTRCTLSTYVIVIAAEERPTSSDLRLLSKLWPLSMLSAVRLTCLITFSDRRPPKIRIANRRLLCLRGRAVTTKGAKPWFIYLSLFLRYAWPCVCAFVSVCTYVCMCVSIILIRRARLIKRITDIVLSEL